MYSDKSKLNELATLASQIRSEVDAVIAAMRPPADDGFKISPVPRRNDSAVRKARLRGKLNRAVFVKQLMRPGELPLKEFVLAETQRRNVCRAVVYDGLRMGHYPGVRVRHLNQRVCFVTVKSLDLAPAPSPPLLGEITMKEFVARVSDIQGRLPQAIYRRIERGYYPDLKIRHLNKMRTFVSGAPVEGLNLPTIS